MNRIKKSMAAAGLAAGLLGGGAAGAILGTTGVSGAQETTTTVEQEAGGTTDSGRPDRSARFAETLAPLVADGTITQAQADAVVAALAEAGPPEGGRGGPGGGHGHGRGGHGLDAAATALGVTADELRTAIQGGQTIAEFAAEKGVDVQTVIDAMIADASTRINERVASGDMTQEEADEKLVELTTRITDAVNNGRPERPADARADSEDETPSTTTG